MLRVRVVMQNAIGGSPYLATHYFLDDASQTDANNAVAAVGTFWGAVDAFMVNDITWATEAEVAVLDTQGIQTGVWATTPASGAGGSTLESLPLASMGLVRWITGAFSGGRRIRGRTFIPGLHDGNNDNGRLLASTAAAIDTAAEALIADTATRLGVWSRKNGVIAGATSATVWTEFASLRSRRD